MTFLNWITREIRERLINEELKQGKNLKFIVLEDNVSLVQINRADSCEMINEKLSSFKAKREYKLIYPLFGRLVGL